VKLVSKLCELSDPHGDYLHYQFTTSNDKNLALQASFTHHLKLDKDFFENVDHATGFVAKIHWNKEGVKYMTDSNAKINKPVSVAVAKMLGYEELCYQYPFKIPHHWKKEEGPFYMLAPNNPCMEVTSVISPQSGGSQWEK
jgi:hypothetical protein